MDALFAFSIILIWILICVLARFITTLLHELGHAIPALLFTHQEVFVFVGSYAEKEKNVGLRFGRLHIYVHFNILQLYSGLCAFQGNASTFQQLIITLSGPLLSLISGVILIMTIVMHNYADNTIIFIAVFIFSFIYDFIINIIPREIGVKLKSGNVIYNDGSNIRRLLAKMNLPPEFDNGMKLKAQGEYQEASDIFSDLMYQGHHQKQIYSELIACLVATKQFDEALEVYEKYDGRYKLKAQDHFTLSKIYFEKNLMREAIKSIQKSIHLDFRNSTYLAFWGQCLLETGDYEIAIKKFNAAIFHNKNDIEGYLYRALAFIKKDEMSSALSDLTVARDLGPKNPVVSLHFGFYYQSLGQKHLAIKNFKNAKALGSDHHGLDYFIEELKTKNF